LETVGDTKVLDVINSPGGEANVAEKLAIMCGEHCKIFRALVPNSAKSAATMWALSADKILMGIYQR
jgi:ClpP class serine protease